MSVAPESTHQVSIGAKLKLTSEQTKARIISFVARQAAYLVQSFLTCPVFLQKKHVKTSFYFSVFLC